MALQSSGLITLEDIQAEFGGPTSPIALQNYYRGGSYVPDVSANSSIPTSGLIGLQDFYGAVSVLPQLTDLTDPLTSVELTISGNRPQVSIRFNTDGTIDEASGDTGSALSYSQVGAWLNAIPPDSAADWEVRVTVDSEDTGDPGTWAGSARGSFLTLDSARTFTWSKDGTDTGTASSEVTITLRQVSDTANSASRSNLTYSVTISS